MTWGWGSSTWTSSTVRHLCHCRVVVLFASCVSVCVCVCGFVFGPGPITCVCFSQDGQCTLSSSLDSTVRLLDKSTGEMLGEWVAAIFERVSLRSALSRVVRLCARYTGHTMKGYKLECCLSCKDTHVLSCSEDGHVYFWDLVEVRNKTVANQKH